MSFEANISIGKYLAGLRKETGITQVQLAAKLGTPQSFISKVETGERGLHLSEVYRYAAALGISEEQLVADIKKVLGY